MSEETAPPAELLILYVLGETDDRLTRQEIQQAVEDTTGHRLAESTLSDALTRILDAGLIYERVICRDGSTTRQYHSDNRTGE